ncbi:MAG: ABC-2 family transporter protein [bacterium]
MLLSVVGKYTKLSWRIFLANLSSALSFRISFFLEIFGGVMFFCGQFFLWTVFFNQFPMVGGWTSKDVILTYSLFLFSYSILEAFAGGIMRLAEIINDGSLDYYLTYPKAILWHISVSRADVIALSTVILGFVFFLASGPIELSKILLFLLASCFSMILMFNFFIITQSIAFFIGGFSDGAKAVRYLLSVVSPYPFSIFPAPFKYLLMTIIPSFFIVTLPARLVNNFSFQTLAILICACAVSSFIAHKVFKAGLRRYESGNMINVRL